MNVQTLVGYYDSNTFVVEYNGTVLIIDAGAPREAVLQAAANKKPQAILLTHEHFDHTYHLDDYRKQFGCPVVSPANEDEITVGKVKIKPMLCPGHSPASVVYLIGDCLFTGDVLFSDTIGRTDLTSGKIPAKATPEIRAKNEAQMQETLKRLLGVKFKTAYHGHHEPSTYEEQQKNIRRFVHT